MATNMKSIHCPNCGASIQISDDGRNKFFCTYCGSQILMDTEHKTIEHIYHKMDEAQIIREKRKTKAYEDQEIKNKRERKILLLILLMIVLAGIVVFCLSKARVIKPLYVKPPSRNDDVYIGMDYTDVKQIFWDKGFESIQLYPLADIKDADDSRIGKVSKVTIEGSDNFSTWYLFGGWKANEYDWDSLVVISYHSLK